MGCLGVESGLNFTNLILCKYPLSSLYILEELIVTSVVVVLAVYVPPEL